MNEVLQNPAAQAELAELALIAYSNGKRLQDRFDLPGKISVAEITHRYRTIFYTKHPITLPLPTLIRPCHV